MGVHTETGVTAVEPAGTKDVQTVDDSGRQPVGRIEGVEIERLLPRSDARGSLTPFLSLDAPFWRDPVVYAYAVTIEPGAIKGWGMHKIQDDRYYVPAVPLRVVLYDGRVESPTFQSFQEIWFSEKSSGLLRIPTGVWHADQNWGETEVHLVNFPTRPYDPADPDKYRIDPLSGEIPFDWSIPTVG